MVFLPLLEMVHALSSDRDSICLHVFLSLSPTYDAYKDGYISPITLWYLYLLPLLARIHIYDLRRLPPHYIRRLLIVWHSLPSADIYIDDIGVVVCSLIYVLSHHYVFWWYLLYRSHPVYNDHVRHICLLIFMPYLHLGGHIFSKVHIYVYNIYIKESAMYAYFISSVR